MHKPVLLKEMLEFLDPKDNYRYVDATFGAGGYTKAILDHARSTVYAIDQDATVAQYFDEIKNRYHDRVFFQCLKFSNIADIIPEDIKVDGVLFDVGVSTMQLKNPERGFSFLHDGPLDMRMDNKASISAGVVINSFYEAKLADLIYELGGERKAKKIARYIVSARQKQVIKTTAELAEIIRSCFPKRYYRIDPATRTFQAIRIFVNNELQELRDGLDAAVSILAPGGKIVVVSFHSLEDRIVKYKFRELSQSGDFCLLHKKVIRPQEEERFENPSSRSAKLRAIQKICELR